MPQSCTPFSFSRILLPLIVQLYGWKNKLLRLLLKTYTYPVIMQVCSVCGMSASGLHRKHQRYDLGHIDRNAEWTAYLAPNPGSNPPPNPGLSTLCAVLVAKLIHVPSLGNVWHSNDPKFRTIVSTVTSTCISGWQRKPRPRLKHGTLSQSINIQTGICSCLGGGYVSNKVDFYHKLWVSRGPGPEATTLLLPILPIIKPRQLCWAGFIVMLICVCVCVCLCVCVCVSVCLSVCLCVC